MQKALSSKFRDTPHVSECDDEDAIFVNSDTAAEYLFMSHQALLQLRYRGVGPRAFRDGRGLLWNVADLDAWVLEQTVNNREEKHQK